jgi:hypothetical protein
MIMYIIKLRSAEDCECLYAREKGSDLIYSTPTFLDKLRGNHKKKKTLSQDGGDTNRVSLKYEALLLRQRVQ